MEAHKPRRYVCGVYIQQHEVWLGEFDATPEELLLFATVDADDVASYDLVMRMVQTQQVYEEWWDRTKYGNKKKR